MKRSEQSNRGSTDYERFKDVSDGDDISSSGMAIVRHRAPRGMVYQYSNCIVDARRSGLFGTPKGDTMSYRW